MVAGDLVFVNSHGLFRSLVRYWSRRWSHVAIAINSKEVVSCDWPRVKIDTLANYLSKGYEVKIMAPVIKLSSKEKRLLVSYAKSFVGRQYDWKGLLSFLIGAKVQRKSAFFCSELTKQCYDFIRNPLLRKEASWTTPDDCYSSMLIKECE